MKNTPTRYTDSAISDVTGCVYDSRGNLFASGVPQATRYMTNFAWMAHGSAKFTNVFVPSPYTNRVWGAIGIGWDGRYFTIDRYGIFRILVTHGEAYYAGKVTPTYPNLSGENGPFVFYYRRGIATAAIAGVASAEGKNGQVDMWNYPAGGDPTLSIPHGVDDPFGVAVSLAR